MGENNDAGPRPRRPERFVNRCPTSGPGMVFRQRDGVNIVIADVNIGIEGDSYISLVLQRDGRPRRRNDAPAPATSHLTSDHGLEAPGSEKNSGFDRF